MTREQEKAADDFFLIRQPVYEKLVESLDSLLTMGNGAAVRLHIGMIRAILDRAERFQTAMDQSGGHT
jgi:hypothetical protein